MKIEIKKSKKPIEYERAITFLEQRVDQIHKNKDKELIWILSHPPIYTAGTSHKEDEILDKSIKLYKTNRGGKITYHGPGQLICYLVINLNKRGKDIRKFINIIENTIIKTLVEYKIDGQADRKNIGIWTKGKKKKKKIAAIGIRIKKWIAYHGFSLNISNDIVNYKKIIPCGIKNKDVVTLKEINYQNYSDLPDEIINNFISNLKI